MSQSEPPILVSACVLGANCAFDLRDNTSERVSHLARQRRTIAICPEEIAGLGTPRPASHLMADGHDVLAGRGKVLADNGDDLTEQFVSAAKTVLELAQKHGVKQAYLKSKSPSCASKRVKINHVEVDGFGVTAALLAQHGIEVFSIDAGAKSAPQPQQAPVNDVAAFEV